VLSGELACFQPGENRALVNSQLCCSAFHRVGAIFPLSRIALVPVQFDRRDLPLLTQVPDHFAGNGVNEPWCLIALRSERCCNLSIHQPCGVELAHALLDRLRTSKHGVAAHPALVAELLMGPRLPIDLYPDLAFNSLAINDHLPNHQAQHLLALSTGGRGRLEDASVNRCQGPQWPLGPPE
jgi:hypothetical protein